MIIENKITNYILVYSGVALAILLPLLFSHYVLTLDLVFTPVISMPTDINSTYVFEFLIHIINFMIPSYVIEKTILFIIIVCMGVGGHTLAEKIAHLYGFDSRSSYGYYFFGFIFIFNPFVYSHFIAGQYMVLLGYAFMPFFLTALINFIQVPIFKHSLNVLAWMVLISIVSIHTLGLLVVISIPLISVYAYYRWRDWEWYRLFMSNCSAVLVGFIVVSCYWLIPTMLGKGKMAEAIGDFNSSDFTAFATNDNTLGVLGNVLTMRGFWADSANLYLTPEDVYSWWLIPLCLLGGLVAAGVYKSWKTTHGLTLAFLIMFSISTIIATGTSGSIFSSVNTWIVIHIPLFAGYRDPQKFVGIIVLVYAMFASLGIWQVIDWLNLRKHLLGLVNKFGIFILFIPIMCAPLMLGGFAGQLKSSDYPKDWYGMNEYFKQNGIGKDEKVLALPWHLYMRFGFAERIIANPMDRFFTPKLTINDDPEFKNSHSYAKTDEQQTIRQLLESKTDAVHQLRKLGFRYILIAKEFDYRKYEYLNYEKGLKIIRDTESLLLYRIEPDSME